MDNDLIFGYIVFSPMFIFGLIAYFTVSKSIVNMDDIKIKEDS